MPTDRQESEPRHGADPDDFSSSPTARVVDENHTARVKSVEDQEPAAAAVREARSATAGRTALRATYGRWVLAGAAIQVLIADVGFFFYAVVNEWQISDRAIIG